jgi:hypothetical protein
MTTKYGNMTAWSTVQVWAFGFCSDNESYKKRIKWVFSKAVAIEMHEMQKCRHADDKRL